MLSLVHEVGRGLVHPVPGYFQGPAHAWHRTGVRVGLPTPSLLTVVLTFSGDLALSRAWAGPGLCCSDRRPCALSRSRFPAFAWQAQGRAGGSAHCSLISHLDGALCSKRKRASTPAWPFMPLLEVTHAAASHSAVARASHVATSAFRFKCLQPLVRNEGAGDVGCSTHDAHLCLRLGRELLRAVSPLSAAPLCLFGAHCRAGESNAHCSPNGQGLSLPCARDCGPRSDDTAPRWGSETCRSHCPVP